MTSEEQAAHISRQLDKGLVLAYEAMLAFKRYKKTPVIISRNGQVLAVSPDDMPPARPVD